MYCAAGVTPPRKRKTLCLSLVPRQPAVYCRPSSPLRTIAVPVCASVFRGAVGGSVCGHWTASVCGMHWRFVCSVRCDALLFGLVCLAGMRLVLEVAVWIFFV